MTIAPKLDIEVDTFDFAVREVLICSGPWAAGMLPTEMTCVDLLEVVLFGTMPVGSSEGRLELSVTGFDVETPDSDSELVVLVFELTMLLAFVVTAVVGLIDGQTR